MVKFFLKLINFKADKNIKTISLGDSQNDTGMLEMTDYSCIIKSPKKNILYIKNKNKYYSKHPAPTGWKESLLKIFTKENINF